MKKIIFLFAAVVLYFNFICMFILSAEQSIFKEKIILWILGILLLSNPTIFLAKSTFMKKIVSWVFMKKIVSWINKIVSWIIILYLALSPIAIVGSVYEMKAQKAKIVEYAKDDHWKLSIIEDIENGYGHYWIAYSLKNNGLDTTLFAVGHKEAKDGRVVYRIAAKNKFNESKKLGINNANDIEKYMFKNI